MKVYVVEALENDEYGDYEARAVFADISKARKFIAADTFLRGKTKVWFRETPIPNAVITAFKVQ